MSVAVTKEPPRSSLEQLTDGTRAWLSGISDVLFPRDCLVTEQPVEGGPFRYLSPEGERSLIHARAPHCHTCGFPFFGNTLGNRSCPHCQELEPAFEEGRTLLLARDGGRALVHEMKYHHGTYLLPDIRTLLRERQDFTAFLQEATLVPVPLFPKRERKRGFNQSLLLATAMAEAAGGLPVETLLLRTRDTQSQTRLNRRQRYENVKNAFAMRADAVLSLNKRYILVDDVFTTGATLNACAKTLRRAGATRIAVATLAHG